MKSAFDKFKKREQYLDGIFHLAGIANESTSVLMKDLTRSEVLRQFSPKIIGAKILSNFVNEIKPKFCILFLLLQVLLEVPHSQVMLLVIVI